MFFIYYLPFKSRLSLTELEDLLVSHLHAKYGQGVHIDSRIYLYHQIETCMRWLTTLSSISNDFTLCYRTMVVGTDHDRAL